MWGVTDTERAYRVLVSEIMLQQTQVSRVKIVFRLFLERFPHLEDLAAATNREVILAWRGMGYNNRALRLRDAARAVVREHGGAFPRAAAVLTDLPGIGPYTAAALLNFAFNIPTPCLDTNIRRILHRTFYGPENPDGTWPVPDQALLVLAKEILTIALRHRQPLGFSSTAAEWHAALMDFGSLVQTKNNPRWDICPLTKKGIMKTTQRSFARVRVDRAKSAADHARREPGRFVGSRFVPNRIFRGRIIEALRNADKGLTLPAIGREICIDWDDGRRAWLEALLQKLSAEALIRKKGRNYVLGE